MSAAICGENAVFPATRLGCGEPIETCAEVYRCTDCATPFHRACAQMHFRRSADQRMETAQPEEKKT